MTERYNVLALDARGHGETIPDESARERLAAEGATLFELANEPTR